LCEQAQNCWQTEPDHSFELIDKACTVSPKSARPVIMRATWLMQHQQPLPGFECLLELLKNMPQFAALVAAQLAQAAIELQNSQPECIKLAHQALQSIDSEHPSVDVMRALMQLDAAMGNDHTEQRLLHHLEREASLIAASQWVSFKMRSQADNQPLIRALEKATKPLQRYRCAACGFEAQQHFWQCPGCQAWDSYPPKRIEEL
jgi:lipopolysaccharide biosynthesis regulator YciM